MAKYLIDVNLPYRFSLWKSDDYIHQKDVNDEWKDEQIWDYAATNNLTIVTKDSDFSNRIIFHEPPPKVIHIRFGNMKMREFFTLTTAIRKVLSRRKSAHSKNFWENKFMREDEIVKETRRLRDEYAKRFNYDLDLIFEDLQKKQKESERQYISFSDKKAKIEDVKNIT